MRNPLKFRLVGFSAIIVILAGLIGWATWASWRELGRLEDRFSRGQIRSFEIADHLQATILRLNNALIDHQLTGSSNQLDEFRRASRRLNEWIDEKKPDLDSARERALLNRIDIAYDSFLATAHSAIEARTLASPERRVQLIGGIIEASSTMLDLGSQLEDAHRLNLESLFVGQQKSLLVLQWVISSALFVLVVLGGLLALIVFRDMIRPLQTKLVESHAIIERQEKLASLGVLAAGVAHEIRTPLTAIKARLYRQQTALDPASTAHQDALVIDGEINRLERIVKDVLQFARPSDPDFAPLLVRPFLEEVRELMAGQLEKRGVTLRIEANGTPDEVLADHDQLKQVLLNVVQNAAESIDGSGTVTLRASQRHQHLAKYTGPVIAFEIQDTGHGISSEVQKRLFDPFFSTKKTGTGLGLSIAARILEKHHGALEYRTTPGAGSTFVILLPAAATK